MLRIGNKKYALAVAMTSGTTDHTQLTNRDVADQHPISAITNLQSTLSTKITSDDVKNAEVTVSGTSDTITNHLNTIKTDLGDLGDDITDLNNNKQNKTITISNVSDTVTNHIQTIKNDLGDLGDDVSEIQAKIPSQATSSNQLADKDFVNSSISTNTANYISNNGEPFTSVEQLRAYTGTVTNNDYAFVTGTDSAGNTYYDRYKATVSGSTVTWAKEYRLNNSSFTAAQWSAITSGITSSDVALIGTAIQPDDLGTLAYADAITNGDISGTINQDKITNLTTDLGNKANDSAVVHLSGSETITGAKTFTNSIITQKSTSGSSGNGLTIQDASDSTRMVRLLEYVTTDGSHYARLMNKSYNVDAYVDIKTTSSGTSTFYMRGISSAQCPTPTEDTTSSTQIDTVGARNTKLNTLIPTQSGQSGKFLTTNGTSTSWGTVDALPTQTGHSGSVLTTDGSSASWQGTSSCAVVIESKNPTSADPTWYRVWSDGWVEQGGFIERTAAASQTITLPKEMDSSEYSVILTPDWTTTSTNAPANNKAANTTTTISVIKDGTGEGCFWEVKGVMASS